MSDGDAFGELALLQNSTRTATIVCKTACEFLKIDREDFNQVKFFHLTALSIRLRGNIFLCRVITMKSVQNLTNLLTLLSKLLCFSFIL